VSASTEWPPTRAEGLMRLEAFLPCAGVGYAKNRNYDRGASRHSDVSTLSPWIRHRLITEEETVAAVLNRHRYASAEKFIQEVCWRTYWKGWLELRPSIWQQYRAQMRQQVDALEHDPGMRSRWEESTKGNTGIACFDAWAKELAETGYLHNHARMWFASIWIFTLGLPWTLGADFFLRHLLDGDPASNTLSWRWVAGLQTRGKTYLARTDNIAKYTDGRFPPTHGLARTAPPLAEPPLPRPLPPPAPAPPNTSLPTGLLVTEEDLGPACLLGQCAQIESVAMIRTTANRSPLPLSPNVTEFVAGGLADAAVRVADLSPSPLGPLIDEPEEVVTWAKECGLHQVVYAYVPIGPTREIIDRIGEGMAEAAIPFLPVLRAWDRWFWPHATRGFFPFKARIPEGLRALGLQSC